MTDGGGGDREEEREESIQMFMFQAFLTEDLTENAGFSTRCYNIVKADFCLGPYVHVDVGFCKIPDWLLNACVF